jgi:regulator of replication initiation timing
MRKGLVMDEKLEELQKEIARLSVEVSMLKAKVMICLETVARLREELESLRRKARRPSLRECMEVLKAYEEVEACEQEPP